jgi:hypothetical protein
MVRVPGHRSRGPGSIPDATRFSEKEWVWNGVHSASWVQLSSYLEEKVASPPTSGGRSVGIVRLRTQATEFSLGLQRLYGRHLLKHLWKPRNYIWVKLRQNTEIEVEVNLRPTVSRPDCPGVRRPSGACDQFFFLLEISFRQLRVYYFVAPSLPRGRVCNLLYNCFWALPEQPLLGRSPAELTAIFYCFIRDSPNLARVRVRVTLQLTVSQSVCLGVEPNLGLMTRDIFFLKVTLLSYLGRPLWREVGSVICQSFVNII